jgi:hypothetical protein
MSDKPKRCENLRRNLPQYQLYQNVFRGGRYLRSPPTGTLDPFDANPDRALPNGTYLKPFPNESSRGFTDRLSRAANRNYAQEVVRVYVATLFAQGHAIDREAIVDALGEEIADDIDLRGSTIAAFLRRAFRDALVYGWVGCMTDLPSVESGSILSAYDERERGMRPFSRLISPANVWDWERDPETGEWTSLLIDEGVLSRYGGRRVWSRWTTTTWEVVTEDGVSVDGGEHGYEFIPFDVLLCDEGGGDDDEPPGHSALRDIGDLCVELYNTASELEDLSRKTNFPLMHVKEDPASIQKGSSGDLPVGADSALIIASDVAWISPDTAAVQTCQARLRDIEEQIRRTAGIATRSEESTEAHSGVALRWEYSTRLSLVKLRAEQLRDFEVRLWKTWSRISGIDIPATSVRYPSDYATMPVPADMELLKLLGEIEAPMEVQRAQLRSVVLKQFWHLPNLPDLLKAVDAWEGKAKAAQAMPPTLVEAQQKAADRLGVEGPLAKTKEKAQGEAPAPTDQSGGDDVRAA